MRTGLAWLLAALVLAGCTARVVEPATDAQARAAYLDRAEAISSWREWGFSGRLGVRGGDDGGSGRIDWSVAGDDAVLQFRGALGRGAWRLESGAGGAKLTRADGSVAHAVDADALALAETGWRIPVEALGLWVRGVVNGTPGRETLPPGANIDGRGLPLSLDQDGWSVTFERYDDDTGTWLPKRVEAVRGDTQVKLAISRWHHDGESARDG